MKKEIEGAGQQGMVSEKALPWMRGERVLEHSLQLAAKAWPFISASHRWWPPWEGVTGT